MSALQQQDHRFFPAEFDDGGLKILNIVDIVIIDAANDIPRTGPDPVQVGAGAQVGNQHTRVSNHTVFSAGAAIQVGDGYPE